MLVSGIPPSNEVPYGPYPVVVNKKNDPSKMALVVQDYTYGKYLGNLQVVFDSDGDIVRYSGNPMLLNSSFTPDPEMATDVRIMGAALDKFSKVIIISNIRLISGVQKKYKTLHKPCSTLKLDIFTKYLTLIL